MRGFTFVALAALALSGCSTRRPAASSPDKPAPAVAPAPTPGDRPSLEDARRAERAGQSADALATYEREATRTRNARVNLEALLAAVRLRLSTDPATRDLRKAQSLLEDPLLTPTSASISLPSKALLQLLRETGAPPANARSPH